MSKRDKWGNALVFFKKASGVIDDRKNVFKENGSKMIFLVELLVGETYYTANEEDRLFLDSLDEPPFNDKGEKIDSVTDRDEVLIFSSKKCYPRYLVTF